MIHTLTYKVRFSTGRVLANDLTFETGLTAITGPNEAGKSFVIEMIRYAFFGAAALRGVASDYANLNVSMSFKDYVIHRDLKGAKIYRGEELIATGVKPVNAKILEILGFGLDVFDISCVCNQGEVERLGAMTPADRKRMVDKVIGADRIDDVQKWTAEQGSLLQREIEVLERRAIEPEPPVQPTNYEDASILRAQVEHLKPLNEKYQQLKGWLSAERRAPVAPAPLEDPKSIADLEVYLAEALQIEAERNLIKSLPVIDFDPEAVRAQWAAYDLWCEKKAFVIAYPLATWTQEQIDKWREQLNIRHCLNTKGDELRRLRASPVTTCPCGKEFFIGDTIQPKIEQLTKDMQALALQFEEGDWSVSFIDDQQKALDTWSKEHTLQTWERLKLGVETECPSLPRKRLAEIGTGITPAERDARLAALPQYHDSSVISERLKQLREHAAAVGAYESSKADYEAWAAERDVKQKEAADLSWVVAKLPTLEDALRASETYEHQLKAYSVRMSYYNDLTGEIADKQADLDGWKAARLALGDLRTRIKTYLVPSLSKVASHLLAQMTDGQRSSIVVDENFDVMVDGQRLDTLSGSGKACANLALRIGLGQVLTNNVISLFVGDEIDAAMDADRAASTHSSIRRLTGQISQLMLITHKIPQADHVVTLGESVDAGRIHPGGD